ncbi:MAG: hypothetical protein AAGA33_10560 [Pseudomonadota bacterium]
MMNRGVFLVFVLALQACGGGSAPTTESAPLSATLPASPVVEPSNQFTVDADYLYKDGQRFDLTGVVYVPGEPGYLPWEIEGMAALPPAVRSRIESDISGIRVMGANTVRLWGAPAYTYEVIRSLGDLNILQTIWLDGNVSDFHDAGYKSASRDYIRTVVDRVYAAYPQNNPPLVAFLVGNELSEAGILSTNAAHPGITSFTGNYFSADNVNASEAFIAEMADFLRRYEWENYGRTSLISYANEIRTIELIDTPFLDFRAQNAYSYAVPFYRPQTQSGSSSGTLFQGWVEELKYRHPGVPLVITETGLSVSPNAAHRGPPNYGYGGNSEVEQAAGILQNLDDIDGAAVPIAGVTVHEYLDAWWKFGLEDSRSQDPDDIEEWFGLVRLIPADDGYRTAARPAYNELRARWSAQDP